MNETPGTPAASVRRRLFFALWPDDAVRERLHAAARAVPGRRAGGRWVPPSNLHLTLAFLHSVDAALVPSLEAVGAALALPRMTLVLYRVGYFQRPRVLWLGPGAMPPPELLAFETGLWRALAPLGFERRHDAFRPHVAVCRKAPPPPDDAAIEPLEWSVREWALVESTIGPAGAVYRPLVRWPAAD